MSHITKISRYDTQDKSNFLKVFLLHNFVKCFSDARVYEIVNNCCSVVQNICSKWKLMMLEVVDKNVFKIMTVSDNLVFICRF